MFIHVFFRWQQIVGDCGSSCQPFNYKKMQSMVKQSYKKPEAKSPCQWASTRKFNQEVPYSEYVQSRSDTKKIAIVTCGLRTAWNWQNGKTSPRIWRQFGHQRRSVINLVTFLYKVRAFNVVTCLLHTFIWVVIWQGLKLRVDKTTPVMKWLAYVLKI